ncbi:hypothetical protein BCR33DRAFT_720491 [Rhizoclosmatium globosum]|uniref:Protein-S-isoprenylcysteine O-methyltransferase n=1 Tax=Rhizoclosmatium globosum TaxID=329046 RepID=A0A1Y2BVP3_9FUNG|nr:hypothetical protein BCR33DRAFT_720491 [Rhizoclosmatium globosum]|eukprot:ORY38816.1 hypothetical protein BCR33DRAFT_720491 [Rhizoclosmatium globosum]
MTPGDWRALHLGISAILVSLSIVDRTTPSKEKPVDIRQYSKSEPFLVVQQALGTCVVAAGLLQMFDVLIARPELFDSPWTSSQRRAAFLADGCVLLRLWAMGTLNNDFTFVVRSPPSNSLCTKGPYEILLHPGYAGIIGWAIFQCSWLLDEKAPFIDIITRGMDILLEHKLNLYALVTLDLGKFMDLSWFLFSGVLVVTALLLPPGLHKRMQKEEEELKKTFGDKFDEYRANRWRLVPFLY